MKLDLGSSNPLRGASWLLSNPATEQLLPGSERFQGQRLQDICATLGDSFIRALGYWEHLLEHHEHMSS